MAEKAKFDNKLVMVGRLLTEKRKALGKKYSSRDKFIEERSLELFDGIPWISCRHLANVESGKNWLSVEMLIQHAYALEVNPVELFAEILKVYNEASSGIESPRSSA